MNDTLVRRSIVSKCLARFLSSLRQVNSESLENINKENYHFQVAESLTSTFQQIKTNLELRKRNLITSSKDKWVNQLCTDYDSHLPSSTPVTSYQINSTINGNQINNNSTDFEPGSLIKSKYEPNRTVEPSSSYTSNNTLDSVASFNTSLVTSFNASDSSDSNSTSIHQSIDSGFSAIQQSNQNKAQNRNHKIQNLICKKDEQAFISNLLYFLNLKNENDSNENSLTSNSRSDNLPEHIALSLVKVFSTTEKSFQIDPNELDCWLISEEEVPQKLLPIPNVQFLTQHFNQATNSLISELDENEIDSTMSYQQISCSESNPIDVQTNSLESASIRDNLTDNRTGATDDDQLIENERKLLNNTDLLNSNLSTKPMLTHEQDEMQKLNTLFNSGKFFNFSSLNNSVKYRGSDHWSPPRAMIHVVIHPAPKRQELIAKQNYLCCGCGLRIEKQEIPRMLYCYYTGKYFCKYGCHSQTKTIIPAYVINKWSFKLFPVSNFAFQVIQNNYTKPLFNIQDLNPKLFAKVKQFQNLHDMRGQLLKLKDYILTCKKAANLLVVYLMFEPKHFVESSKDLTYSLEDLVDLKKDCTTLERVFDLVSESIKHIKKCSNCLAKGFICELCSNSNQTARQSTGSRQGMMDVLFPFEIGRVKQCEACFTCFHLNCFAVVYKLYLNRLLSAFADRTWDFACGIFVIKLWPGSLFLAGIQGVLAAISLIVVSPLIGKWIEKAERLFETKLCLFIQNLCVILSGLFVCFFFSHVENPQTGLLEVLAESAPYAFVLFSILAQVWGSAYTLLLEKDWVLALAPDEDKLSNLNAMLRRIDLCMLTISSFVCGILMEYSDFGAAVFLCLFNFFSRILRVLPVTISLLYREEKHYSNQAIKDEQPKTEKTSQKAGESTEELSESIFDLNTLRLYRKQFLMPGISFGLMYLTVLGFDSITVGYLTNEKLEEKTVGFVALMAGLFGIAATLLYPLLVNKFGVLKTGLFGFILKLIALTLCLVTAFFPDINYKIMEMDLDVFCFLAGITLSRAGLWIADLAINQLIQTETSNPPVIGGVQNSINLIFELMKFSLVMCLPSLSQFWILILFSYVSVGSGLTLYSLYMSRLSNKKLH